MKSINIENRLWHSLCLAAPVAMLAACTPDNTPTPDPSSPQGEFFAALSSHCGKAYSGRLVSNDAADADFANAAMVMHVASCSDSEIKVPFQLELTDENGELSWDRSRTWVITRTDAGLRLKHDHRHEDGTEDAVTMYGGDTAAVGIARGQDFPIDEDSIALFKREGLTASLTNVWRVEVDPAGQSNAQFAYQLSRTKEGGAPEDRLFRVEFDLTKEVETPPPAWGHE